MRQDRAVGYDHILMARAKWKKRADELLPLYRELGPEFQPMGLYSGIPESDRQARLAVLPRRWVIDRTFAWLGPNRRTKGLDRHAIF